MVLQSVRPSIRCGIRIRGSIDRHRSQPIELVADPRLDLVFGQMMPLGNIGISGAERADKRREAGAEKAAIREFAEIGIPVFHSKYPIGCEGIFDAAAGGPADKLSRTAVKTYG